jgi:hypothetical protein
MTRFDELVARKQYGAQISKEEATQWAEAIILEVMGFEYGYDRERAIEELIASWDEATGLMADEIKEKLLSGEIDPTKLPPETQITV